jgi:hypothetical protein
VALRAHLFAAYSRVHRSLEKILARTIIGAIIYIYIEIEWKGKKIKTSQMECGQHITYMYYGSSVFHQTRRRVDSKPAGKVNETWGQLSFEFHNENDFRDLDKFQQDSNMYYTCVQRFNLFLESKTHF